MKFNDRPAIVLFVIFQSSHHRDVSLKVRQKLALLHRPSLTRNDESFQARNREPTGPAPGRAFSRLFKASKYLSSSFVTMVNQESGTNFNPVAHYESLLRMGEKPMPIAAVEVLAEVIARSHSTTMTELFQELQDAVALLQKEAYNPVSLTAGTALLLRFVSLQTPPPGLSFEAHKRNVCQRARDFVRDSQLCSDRIVKEAAAFISDAQIIMTHGSVCNLS